MVVQIKTIRIHNINIQHQKINAKDSAEIFVDLLKNSLRCVHHYA